jgi:phospholipid-binding lipoprotein MlaA
MKRLPVILLIILLLAPGGFVRAEERSLPAKPVDLLRDEPAAEGKAIEATSYDPLEPMNRVFFEINDKLYFWVVKPVRIGYSAVLPEGVRQCFQNFFENVSSPVSLINNLLQGQFEDAGVVFSRFLINSTLGVYGFGDPASVSFGLTPRPTDFGETLGVYGIGEGVYLYWPFIGPSNIRDTVGMAGDVAMHPVSYMELTWEEAGTYYVVTKINAQSLQPAVYEDFKKLSLDPYVAIRQAYFEFRQGKIEKKQN